MISGITNTGTAGGSTSVLTTENPGGSVDSGTSGTATFTADALSSPTWSVSAATTGASGVTYTYGFSTSLVTAITTLTATVPPGTTGTPTLGTTTGITLGGVSRSGTTLTFSGVSLGLGTTVSIAINGLTNTGTAGTYTSEIVAGIALPVLGSILASGVTASVTFSGGLTLTSPATLSWAGTITGTAYTTVDPTSADQQFTLDDEQGSAAGWHITVAATTFTSVSLKTFPDLGTFSFTGSLTSATATTAPTASCSSCTFPATSTTYPVAITTATSSPTPATVFNAAAGTGVGPMTIGGSGAANPVGWWLRVPATAIVGAYSSTITIAVVSGP